MKQRWVILVVVATWAWGISATIAEAQSSGQPGSSQLLELTNAARQAAGAPPLTLDADLSRAAAAHAELMAEHAQLSHQFPGEPELLERLAAQARGLLDAVAENVAVAADVTRAHDALMHSPPHKKNLLNSLYNAVGLALVKRGAMLYVVEDFAHATPHPSADDASHAVARAVERLRAESTLAPLQDASSAAEKQAACRMAQHDSLSDADSTASYTARYTSFNPEQLPASARRAVLHAELHTMAVGVCFARTQQYPAGTYWVVLFLN